MLLLKRLAQARRDNDQRLVAVVQKQLAAVDPDTATGILQATYLVAGVEQGWLPADTYDELQKLVDADEITDPNLLAMLQQIERREP